LTDPDKLLEYKLQKNILIESLPTVVMRKKARESWGNLLLDQNSFVTRAAEEYLNTRLDNNDIEQEIPATYNLVKPN